MNAQRKRRRLSISLGCLFIVLTVVSLFIGRFANRYHEWNRLYYELKSYGAYISVEYSSWLPECENPFLADVCEIVDTPSVREVTFHGDWSPPHPKDLGMWSYSYPK
jgi:hypothetical protein